MIIIKRIIRFIEGNDVVPLVLGSICKRNLFEIILKIDGCSCFIFVFRVRCYKILLK